MKRADFFKFYDITQHLKLYEIGSLWITFHSHKEATFPFATTRLTK